MNIQAKNTEHLPRRHLVLTCQHSICSALGSLECSRTVTFGEQSLHPLPSEILLHIIYSMTIPTRLFAPTFEALNNTMEQVCSPFSLLFVIVFCYCSLFFNFLICCLQANIELLKKTYESTDDIDLYVGILLERIVDPTALVCPFFRKFSSSKMALNSQWWILK